MVITIEPGMFAFQHPCYYIHWKFLRYLCPSYCQISETLSQYRDQDRGELYHSIFFCAESVASYKWKIGWRPCRWWTPSCALCFSTQGGKCCWIWILKMRFNCHSLTDRRRWRSLPGAFGIRTILNNGGHQLQAELESRNKIHRIWFLDTCLITCSSRLRVSRVKASFASLILVSLISRAIFDISSFKFELNVFWYASSNADSIYPTDIFRWNLNVRA